MGPVQASISNVHYMLTAPTQVQPEMLPPVPTFTLGITGPKQIVTAGKEPVARRVILLPLASFWTFVSAPRVEPSIVTQGLVTAKYTIPSAPLSLVELRKSGLAPLRLCNVESVTTVSSGTAVCVAACSVPTTQVSAISSQPSKY